MAEEARRSSAYHAAQTAVAWAAAEGWNPGLDDAQRFLQADPEAFLWTERDGDIVATVSHQHIYGLLFKVLWPLAAGRAIVFAAVASAASCSIARWSAPQGGRPGWTACSPSRMRTSVPGSSSPTGTFGGA